MTRIKGGFQTQVGEPRTHRDLKIEVEATQWEGKRAEHAQAVADIGEALTMIESQDRQPDDWERASLAQAIDMLARGQYGYASRFADLAITPAAKRSTHNRSVDPRLDRLGLHTSKYAFEDALTQPLRQEPHFEPVTFQAQPET